MRVFAKGDYIFKLWEYVFSTTIEMDEKGVETTYSLKEM